MAQYTELRYFHLPPKLALQTSLQVININNLISELQLLLNTKVDKLYNKQLSQKSFTITDKNTISKSLNLIVDLLNLIDSLPDIVLSDWNTLDVDDMSYIRNKPNVPILDLSGLIPASYLPSYVDDILEYPSFHDLPQPGEPGKIYVTTDNDLTYRWSGTTYVEISKSIITGVKGDAEADYRIGNVNLTAANIGLGNVVNIDLSKAIKGITRNGLTFTYTCLDGTTGTFTQQDNNTTYSAGTGISLSGTTFALALTKKLVTDALGYTPPTTDTNTHRPILVNGTEILGNNTTVLNLKAGSNVTLTNSSGTVTIASTDTNTWRGIQDNLTSSTNTTESLSAKLGYLLANGSARDDTKLPLAGGTLTGKVNVNSSYRNAGMYGVYDSHYLGHVWSMGTSYAISADGKDPASLYGMGYFHTNWSNSASYNTNNANKTALGTYAGGHQIGFFNNGVLGTSIGFNGNVWTKGGFIKSGGTSSQFLKADGSVDSNAYITGITKTMVTTALGYTPPTTDTTYSAGTGISLSGTTFSNSGVRATTINGNYLRVNTNGTNADLTIPYSTSAAYLVYSYICGASKAAGYRKFATWTRESTSTHDTTLVLLATNHYNGKATAILNISYRKESNATSYTADQTYARWESRGYQTLPDIRFTIKCTSSTSTLNLYINESTWESWRFTKLDEGGWSSKENSWSFINGYDVEPVSIPSDETQITPSDYSYAYRAGTIYTTITNPDTSTAYYIPFVSSLSNSYYPARTNNGIGYNCKEGTTSAQGWGELKLGNSTASGTAGNKRGYILMYSSGSNYIEVTPATLTANRTIYFPDAGGTLALTSQIPTNYLPLSGGTMSNTNLVSNLNADLLDGLDKTSFPVMTVSGSTAFASGDNCDNTTVGTYYSPNATISASLTNTPHTSSNFKLWHIATGSSNYPIQIAVVYDNRMYMRGRSSGGTWTSWQRFAFTDSNITGNAASATKLQTARTIWGQSFNGTADVSGSITGATSITATGLTTTKTLSISSTSGEDHLIFSRGGNNYITAPSGGNISFVCGGKSVSNANRDMYISDGAVNITGTLNVSSNSTIGGTLGVTGNTTLGEGLYMENNKIFYIKDTGATNRDALKVSTSNNLNLGYGLREQASGTYIYGGTSGILFRTNGNTTRAIIDSSGNVGIGTTSPSEKLHVNGNILANGTASAVGFSATGKNDTYVLLAGGGTKLLSEIGSADTKNTAGSSDLGDTKLYLVGAKSLATYAQTYSNDYVYIGTDNALHSNNVVATTLSAGSYLHVVGTLMYKELGVCYWEMNNIPLVINAGTGTLNVTKAWVVSSDIRNKDIISDIDISINAVAESPIFNYKLKDVDGDDVMVGTSALYWLQILPNVVKKSAGDYLAVDYGATALTSAITVAREVVKLDKKIKLLEEENKQLKEELLLLKSQINDILTTINKSTNNK